MNPRQNRWLFLIIPLLALAIWVDLSKQITIANPFKPSETLVSRNVDTRLGLDLRGGLQALLEADVPADQAVSAEDLKTARQILENRANALGVSEVVMQTAPPRRIVAEFPGLQNPEEVVSALQQTALLEFVDFGSTYIAAGTVVETYTGDAPSEGQQNAYHTVMTGAELKSVGVTNDQLGNTVVNFELKPDGAVVFGQYTTNNVGKYLGIVLDKTVISSPRVDSAITSGQGMISGNFTSESANALAVQLRYGSLPIPVKVVESRSVGPTLGEESVHRSIIAGIIGLSAVILFMLIYYRLPGFVASLALACYALFSLMLFKLIPVVLTLPGIAGFILSIGMAVDANILIFERLKEELRSGKKLHQAIELAWKRAWPSIRDSNFSTIITCLILFWFGSAFGASMVKGFALTLSLGVGVSLFTAIIVSRTFLHLLLDNIKFTEHPRWFGIKEIL
jgi:preprotein translocase subunit SecD